MGRVRVVQGTSFKGHNGLKSISQEMGGFKEFKRFAIGIGRPEQRDQGIVASYVLSEFSEEEKKTLEEEVFPKIFERLIKNELSPDIN